MARTKKLTPAEALAQEVQKLKGELGLVCALSWPFENPTPVDPKFAFEHALGVAQATGRPRPSVVPAWTYHTYQGGSVSRGCFSATSHSRGYTDKTTTQGQGGPWFKTELEALQALRYRMTRDAAETLMRIDRKIEAAR